MGGSSAATPLHGFTVFDEVIALRRRSLDLTARTVSVREQLLELDGGIMQLGRPKSRAGRRTIAIPSAIIPALTEHLAAYVNETEDAFVFLSKRGAFLRGGNFRRGGQAGGGAQGDGDARAALPRSSPHRQHARSLVRASVADLKARTGHDSDQAALIYQHATRDADQKIADALSARVRAERKGKRKKKS
ncbi:hypothetical protein ACIBH1_46255 [Nonomuraea sp. NPDC050663]|uniref:hypothetical protein n=1 Tax=Nonomuraea sp. NPDC050663 TaxID=3364370 RepID=UPI0037B19A62